MAEKILNTRILQKVASLEEWNSSSLKLKKGELAFATVAASAGTGLTEPVVMVKIGTDEEKTFAELPWAFHAKASDVLAACKSQEALTAFVNSVIADAGIASNDSMTALAGRVTTAEGKITTLEGEMDAVEGKAAANEAAIASLKSLVGDDKVADQIASQIAALKLADTYADKVHGHEIADVNGLSDAIAAAKKAGDDAAAALGAYKTTNDAAVKVNSDAITAIKDGTTIDSFKDVEEALAGKQASGDFAVNGHKHEIADVNGLSDAIADAKKAGTDAAGAAAQALVDAKAYTDAEMTRLVGEDTVADQIADQIDALDLANTYDAKGAAAAAQAAAEGHADSLNTAMDGRMQAVEAKKHEHANKTVLDGITAEKVAAWDAAEQNAKDYADGLDEAMETRMQAVEAKLGAGEGGVDAQIEAAVAAEAALREAADAGLQEQVTANAGAIAALEELVGDDKVADAIAEAVKEEADRAKGIEGGLESRLAAVENDHLVAADKTELEGKIKANADAIELLTNGVDSETVDGVNDLIKYVNDHGTEVTGIKADIKTNADDIDALEGRMDAAEGAIALKAAQADLETLAGRVTTAEGEIDTLQSDLDTAEAAIAALDELVGDEAVADQIDAAIEALKIGDYAKAADLTAAINQHAADKKTLEDAIALKANDADLAAIAKTGNVNDLVQTEGDVLVFDCGGAN